MSRQLATYEKIVERQLDAVRDKSPHRRSRQGGEKSRRERSRPPPSVIPPGEYQGRVSRLLREGKRGGFVSVAVAGGKASVFFPSREAVGMALGTKVRCVIGESQNPRHEGKMEAKQLKKME